MNAGISKTTKNKEERPLPVTQLMGAKGNGDMQAAKRD